MTNMTQEMTERLVVGVVKQGMDHSVINLSWQTQAKLTRLRLQALDQLDQPSAGFGFSSLSRGFAVATAVTLAATLWVLPDKVEMHPSVLVLSSDTSTDASAANLDVSVMDILMSGEDMDLLENLDMYEWLDAEYG
ncbi:hypothetical protein RCF98_16340 [Thiothrix lacustris]|uniref:Anti sigma-E protein RseA N-terminal domain-containing protein n=1 Tax=Thiothrix lacustris TaxID=525917 RepID=A0ABY9MQT2_9GAMM|nr:hypothetical protein [Thiothrix lacustris]WML90525.1 hypothetical protein RCF98_16340 [Thiothrix lacustris]